MLSGCDAADESEANDDLTVSELTGVWEQSCTQDADDDSQYNTETMTIADTSVAIEMGSFSDADCSEQSMLISIVGTLADAQELDAPEGAKTLDFTPSAATLTLKTAVMVEYFNAESICGGSWVLNEAKAILDVICEGSDVGDGLAAILDPKYDIYKIEDSKLYTGDTTSTSDTRASAFSTAYYTKGSVE